MVELDSTQNLILLASLAIPILGLFLAWGFYGNIMAESRGTRKMIGIAREIQRGARAYLKAEYKWVFIFAGILAVVMYVVLDGLDGRWDRPWNALSFLVGLVGTALAGWLGMMVAVKTNVRTAAAARTGSIRPLRLAFTGGAIMGAMVVGFALIGIVSLFYFFTLIGEANPVRFLLGYGFGTSLMCVFSRVGGGIFTKAADIGADLVGKVEAGIPEDDPRNPGVIADNVGDNVGDCVGMGADLFESYSITILIAMLAGYFDIFNRPLGESVVAVASSAEALNAILLPLAISSVGILAFLIATYFVRGREGSNPLLALGKGVLVAFALTVFGSWLVTMWLMPSSWGVLTICIIIGILTGVAIGANTWYFTGYEFRPTRDVARASRTGAATNVISGFAVGLKSVAFPAIFIAVAILLSYQLAEVYGIAIAAMGMLSMTGIVVAIDSFGPIADNAGGIAEMAGLPSEVRQRTDQLDAIGNTSAAMAKGFAIASSGVVALAAFQETLNMWGEYLFESGTSAYGSVHETVAEVIIPQIALSEPTVIVGLIIGAMLPFVFSAYLMEAVGKAAAEMIEEIRRQFREIPGIMEGTTPPDSATCVRISTQAALKGMIIPGIIAISSTLVVGFLLGPAAIAGFLIGLTITGLLLALMMANAGGAWDNAKKWIETGQLGGKGTKIHAAAVTGDTVGDPFKDTAGPSLNSLIKVINMIALLFIPLIAAYAIF